MNDFSSWSLKRICVLYFWTIEKHLTLYLMCHWSPSCKKLNFLTFCLSGWWTISCIKKTGCSWWYLFSSYCHFQGCRAQYWILCFFSNLHRWCCQDDFVTQVCSCNVCRWHIVPWSNSSCWWFWWCPVGPEQVRGMVWWQPSMVEPYKMQTYGVVQE